MSFPPGEPPEPDEQPAETADDSPAAPQPSLTAMMWWTTTLVPMMRVLVLARSSNLDTRETRALLALSLATTAFYYAYETRILVKTIAYTARQRPLLVAAVLAPYFSELADPTNVRRVVLVSTAALWLRLVDQPGINDERERLRREAVVQVDEALRWSDVAESRRRRYTVDEVLRTVFHDGPHGKLRAALTALVTASVLLALRKAPPATAGRRPVATAAGATRAFAATLLPGGRK